MTSKDLLHLVEKIDKKMTELLVNGNHDYGSKDVEDFNNMYFACLKAIDILERGYKGTYLDDLTAGIK